MPVHDAIPAWLSTGHDLPGEATVTAGPKDSYNPVAAAQSTPASSSHSAETPSNPCDRLADTLLAEIAAGFQSLASIASEHRIPYPTFTLWLLQPAIQQKLADLSLAIAGAARLTATAALPDIVRGLKATVDHLSSPAVIATVPAGTDPLRVQALTLRRHRATISASYLLYRIARFTLPGAHPAKPAPASQTHPRANRAADSRDSRDPRFEFPRLTDSDLRSLEGIRRLDELGILDELAAAACVELEKIESESGESESSKPESGKPESSKPHSPQNADPRPTSAPARPSDSSRAPSDNPATDPAANAEADLNITFSEQAIDDLLDDMDLDEVQAKVFRADPLAWFEANSDGPVINVNLDEADSPASPGNAAGDG